MALSAGGGERCQRTSFRPRKAICAYIIDFGEFFFRRAGEEEEGGGKRRIRAIADIPKEANLNHSTLSYIIERDGGL